MNTAVGARSATSPGEPKRRTLATFLFSTSLSTAEAHKYEVTFIGFMELLVLLRFRTFPFEERAICASSKNLSVYLLLDVVLILPGEGRCSSILRI